MNVDCSRTFQNVGVLMLVTTFGLFAPHRVLAYNSEEHKVITDMGVAQVIVDSSVTLPYPTRFLTATLTDVQAGYRAAKKFAVGFETGGCNSCDTLPDVQDNCYWYDYVQRAYNLNIWIPPTGNLRTNVLAVMAWAAGSQRSFTLGELVALYGDYRMTVSKGAPGVCYLTLHSTNSVVFDQGNAIFHDYYCPSPLDAVTFLRHIGSGVVPPFGRLDNAGGNTAGDHECEEAGWWGDQMLRIAHVNDWHFSSAGVAWYVGMHRLALVYVDSARSNPAYWNTALNYEANALHSLTDLFAFGHVVTNRGRASHGIVSNAGMTNHASYKWMQNALKMGSGVRDNDGNVTVSGNLPTIRDTSTVRDEFMPTYVGSWALYADRERRWHNYGNENGATVRNLLGAKYTILGDALLRNMADTAKHVIAQSVRASVQSLFDAFVSLNQGSSVGQIGSSGSEFFAALKYLPVFVESDPDHYFTGMWTPYAAAIDKISGANVVPPDWGQCAMPFIDGSIGDWLPPTQSSPCAVFPSPTAVEPDNESALPTSIQLGQNYPNPFNPSTTIEFSIPRKDDVSIKIYNVQGRVVRDLVTAQFPAGIHSIGWNGVADDGNKVASGVYVYRITTSDGSIAKKMLLLK